LFVLGLGLAINGEAYRQLVAQALASLPFIYMSGVAALTCGLAILNRHNVWARDWRSIITVIGYLLLIVGVFRLLAPPFVELIGRNVMTHAVFPPAMAAVLLLLGAVLTLRGYAPTTASR
jgi:hypothetical protein